MLSPILFNYACFTIPSITHNLKNIFKTSLHSFPTANAIQFLKPIQTKPKQNLGNEIDEMELVLSTVNRSIVVPEESSIGFIDDDDDCLVKRQRR